MCEIFHSMNNYSIKNKTREGRLNETCVLQQFTLVLEIAHALSLAMKNVPITKGRDIVTLRLSFL